MWLADIRIIPIMATAVRGIGIHGAIMIRGGDGAVHHGHGGGVPLLRGVPPGGGARHGLGARLGVGVRLGVCHPVRITRRRVPMLLTVLMPAQAPTVEILIETAPAPDLLQQSAIHSVDVRQAHKVPTVMV